MRAVFIHLGLPVMRWLDVGIETRSKLKSTVLHNIA